MATSFVWREISILLIALIIALVVNVVYLWGSYADFYGPKVKSKKAQLRRAVADSTGMLMTSAAIFTSFTFAVLIGKFATSDSEQNSSSTNSTSSPSLSSSQPPLPPRQSPPPLPPRQFPPPLPPRQFPILPPIPPGQLPPPPPPPRLATSKTKSTNPFDSDSD